ncbi:SDR family NAD(P)-dependent oxidoreductase [Primorskyibacter sp. S87]|uniref:SDR family NAD(P)-dependent oxidoreductase n=1 Tax=Primorskyibacter sp. S87 TaxID=3415126 RepID=UPI003C7B3FCC
MNRMQGKVAIITGGASGVGLAASELFLKEGAKVVIFDLNEESCQAAVEHLASDDVTYVAGDVTNRDDSFRMAAVAEEKFGGIDALVANAGVEGKPLEIMDVTEADFDFPFAVNVKGPLFNMQACVPSMVKRGGGSVVITSSVGATNGGTTTAYNVSKHGVTGLVRCGAKQLAKHNIRVNSVNPGPIATPMFLRVEESLGEDWATAYKQKIPLNRWADPMEIAEALLYMSSDASSWINGTVHMADGGQTAL